MYLFYNALYRQTRNSQIWPFVLFPSFSEKVRGKEKGAKIQGSQGNLRVKMQEARTLTILVSSVNSNAGFISSKVFNLCSCGTR